PVLGRDEPDGTVPHRPPGRAARSGGRCRRGDPLHLGLDRPGQGRALHQRGYLRTAAVLARVFDVREGTGLVAGFPPFALLGPAIGATSVTPDMSVTKPKTLTASAIADAIIAGRATMVFASPAA